MWCPLTPPPNENDVLMEEDEVTVSLYEAIPISESMLPPVVSSKKAEKRQKIDSTSSSPG